MNWYYESDGKPTGPVSAPELHRLIAEGKLTNRALVWCKGMSDWQPLHTVVSPEPEHPLVGPAETLPTDHLATSSEDSSSEEATSTPEPRTPSWENQGGTGWILSFLNTVTEVLTKPTLTFSRLPQTGSWGPPLSFYMLCSTISTAFWVFIFRISPPPEASFVFPGMNPAALHVPLGIILLFVLPLSLLIFPLQAVLTTAVIHASLWITGAAKRPFETTFRIVGYATGTTSLLCVILLASAAAASFAHDPALSQTVMSLASYVMMIWGLIILTKATASAHGISIPRTLFAFCLPILFSCGLGFSLLLFLGTLRTS